MTNGPAREESRTQILKADVFSFLALQIPGGKDVAACLLWSLVPFHGAEQSRSQGPLRKDHRGWMWQGNWQSSMLLPFVEMFTSPRLGDVCSVEPSSEADQCPPSRGRDQSRDSGQGIRAACAGSRPALTTAAHTAPFPLLARGSSVNKRVTEMMSAGFLGSKNSPLHLGQESKGCGSRKEPWKSSVGPALGV